MIKYFKCYSAKFANILVKKGFKILDTEINFKHPQYNVYLFEDTQELRIEFDKYCRIK